MKIYKHVLFLIFSLLLAASVYASGGQDSGEGDGQRNKIFADAFGQDPEFFAFYRAMQAYETALIGGETSLILSPDSEFFKFFGNIKSKSQ